jgi:hypothetical protein
MLKDLTHGHGRAQYTSIIQAGRKDPKLGYPRHSINRTEVSHITLSGTIIRGTLKAPKSQLVTPISTKLQRPDGCD